nr:UvrD-like helicase, ATP-binding domain, P-loop containing nucleoside triphosphate hydrolase [Tanacetum cinerariifolium]
MINSIKNGDQLLPRVNQVSIAGTTLTEQPPLKDKSMWAPDKRIYTMMDLGSLHSEFAMMDLGSLHTWQDLNKKVSISVISLYAAQVVLIQEKLGHKFEKLDGFSVKKLFCDARDHHCLFDADANEYLRMTIIEEKKELQQLDDLVNGDSDYQTGRLLLHCDSTGDLYPVTQQPSSQTLVILLSFSSATWHRRLGHPGDDVLRRLVSKFFISCLSYKLSALCHACQLAKAEATATAKQIEKQKAILGLGYFDDEGNNKGTIDNIICQLGSTFALKDLGTLNYFLVIEIVPHVSE